MDDPYREYLQDVLARERPTTVAVHSALVKLLRSMVNRLAGDLVDAGLADDVISQAFVLLFLPTARRFDPARGSSAQYLYGVVLRAAAEVRVQYGAAGLAKNVRRLRLVWDRREHEQVHCHHREPSYQDAADATCLRLDVERALKAIPPKVRVGAILLAEPEWCLTSAAVVVGMDRHMLRRRLRAWATAAGLSAPV